MIAVLYPFAALAEIAGCYAVWAWWRLDRSPLWLPPGAISLALFAWALAQVAAAAGRAYAAYGVVLSPPRCCGCGWPRASAPTAGT